MKYSGVNRVCCFIKVAIQVLPLASYAGVFTYQGKLTDGASAASGIYDLRFRLAADSFGNSYVGNPVIFGAFPITNGVFTVNLDFGPGVFDGNSRWLQIDVKTNGAGSYSVLTPLQLLTPAPSAYFAQSASNLAGVLPAGQISGPIPSSNLAGHYGSSLSLNNSSNLFLGTFFGEGAALSNVNAMTLNGLASSGFWKVNGNSGTSGSSNFIGTTDNQAFELKVNNARALRVEPTSESPNIIAGAAGNFVGPTAVGAVIGGGGLQGLTNTVLADYAVIAGGLGNKIDKNSGGGSISGGSGNEVDQSSHDSSIGGGGRNIISTAHYSVIAGGEQNVIGSFSTRSTIGGGSKNFIYEEAARSTISGGGDNKIEFQAGGSTIGGGSRNLTWAAGSTIAGGIENTIEIGADYSTVGGGVDNLIGSNANHTTISGGISNRVHELSPFSFVGGGSNNTVSVEAQYATIAGGYSNSVIGAHGTVAGGAMNTAARESFSAGSKAKAVHRGSFVWADSNGSDLQTTSSNQFLIRATGGVGIGTNAPQTALHVVGTVTAAGFNQLSDVNSKENFVSVDTTEMLKRVAALQISRWNFIGEPMASHVGPMAQDFHAAFGTGLDETHIATMDSDGVALAAIQGLNLKLESQLSEKDRRIAELERRLQQLETQVLGKRGEMEVRP